MATALKYYPDRTIGGPCVGEIVVDVTLENYLDRRLFELGYLSEDKIRRLAVQGVVDTCAVMSMLPEEWVNTLGLDELETVSVRYANEESEERPVAGVATLTIGGRTMQAEFIVGPPGSEMLIGQLVLERLDLLADCANQTLVPRPESPDRPLLKLK